MSSKIPVTALILFTVTLTLLPQAYATNCQILDLKTEYPTTAKVMVPFSVQVWFNPTCDGASNGYRLDIFDQNNLLVARAYNNIPYIQVQVTPHNITNDWALMLVIQVNGAGSYGDTGWHFNVNVTGPMPPPIPATPTPTRCHGKHC